MDIEFLERLINILERSALTELEYSENGERIRLVKSASSDAVPAAAALTVAAADASTIPDETRPVEHTVKAGLAGSFHRAPASDQPPFVQVGDVVHEGQTLAIVEAMKMLNAVEADRSGRITRILAEDGAAVDSGTPLFSMEPAGDTDV